MATACIALGSNLGDRRRLLQKAVARLSVEAGEVTALSSFYETEPEGFDSPHRFLNAAAVLETPLSPEELLRVTQRIERELGRVGKSSDGRYADRPIDIDLIFFDEVVIDTPELTLPHPRMAERLFVLDPLCEIAPDFLHPLLHCTVSELRERLSR